MVKNNHTSRRELLKGIGTVGLVGGSMAAVGTAAATPDAPVRKVTATKIARRAVDRIGARSEYAEWDSQGVRSPELFYAKVYNGESVQYAPRSWIFPIERRGSDVGYVNVSAIQTDKPILTYGKATAPQRKLTEVERSGPASSKSLTGRFLYHGGVRFTAETTDGSAVNVRSGRLEKAPLVDDVRKLSPLYSEQDASGSEKQDNPQDWSGEEEEEVYGVPNWTSTDSGGASYTSIGTGDDSWDNWDGCIPIAASMVLGYHEGIYEWEDDDREALIDRMHILMGTGDGDLCSYCTYWSDIPPGIEDYSSGSNSYNADNDSYWWQDNARYQISNNRPIMLNMENGPYTDKGSGHSVCAFGYRVEDGTNYYKVYNGYDDPAEMVIHGSWDDACMTKVSVA